MEIITEVARLLGKAATDLPPDVESALAACLESEENPQARAILKVVLDSSGVFQRGEIISALQRTYKNLTLDSLHRAAKLIKKLSVEDFPQSAPLISDQGTIFPEIKIQY